MNAQELAPEVGFSSDPDAERLAQSLSLAEGFQFVLVYCNSTKLADELTTWLERQVARLRDMPVEPFQRIVVTPLWKQSLSLPELVEQVLAPLVNRAEAIAATPVFINAAVIDSQHDPVWHALLTRLNERRNAIQNRLRAPLTLVLPERFTGLFPTSAPDFWSIRSLEVHIDAGRYAPKTADASYALQPEPMQQSIFSSRNSLAELPAATTIASELGAAQAEYEGVTGSSNSGPEGKPSPNEPRAAERYAIWLERAAALARETGRYEEALHHTRRATSLLESLVKGDPRHRLLPNFARNLQHLGRTCSRLGQREDALVASQEAVQLYRKLAVAEPAAYRPTLAGSLVNLGIALGALGRLEEALNATEEGVSRYRTLAQEHTEAFLPDLATSLNNLGIRFGALGRLEEALNATGEAVRHYHALSKQRPEAFLPDLAMSLDNLGADLNALGRHEEALCATEEAVRHYRALAEQRPDAFLPDLAMSLNNLGVRFDALGRREEALNATEEAVRHYRALVEKRSEAFLPDLATSLNNLGADLNALGRREEALNATEEAVRITLPLAQAYPRAFAASLRGRSNNLAARLIEVGRDPESSAVLTEARLLLAKIDAAAQRP